MERLFWAFVFGAAIGGIVGISKALEFKQRTGRLPEPYELPSIFFGKFLPDV